MSNCSDQQNILCMGGDVLDKPDLLGNQVFVENPNRQCANLSSDSSCMFFTSTDANTLVSFKGHPDPERMNV